MVNRRDILSSVTNMGSELREGDNPDYSDFRVVEEDKYGMNIEVRGRTQPGMAELEVDMAVYDKDSGEVVMVFPTYEVQDALAFANGYAYRKMVEEDDSHVSLIRRLIYRLVP